MGFHPVRCEWVGVMNTYMLGQVQSLQMPLYLYYGILV